MLTSSCTTLAHYPCTTSECTSEPWGGGFDGSPGLICPGQQSLEAHWGLSMPEPLYAARPVRRLRHLPRRAVSGGSDRIRGDIYRSRPIPVGIVVNGDVLDNPNRTRDLRRRLSRSALLGVAGRWDVGPRASGPPTTLMPVSDDKRKGCFCLTPPASTSGRSSGSGPAQEPDEAPTNAVRGFLDMIARSSRRTSRATSSPAGQRLATAVPRRCHPTYKAHRLADGSLTEETPQASSRRSRSSATPWRPWHHADRLRRLRGRRRHRHPRPPGGWPGAVDVVTGGPRPLHQSSTTRPACGSSTPPGRGA